MVGLVSVHVHRGVISSGRFRRGRFNVETCSIISAYCRDVFGDVGLWSGRVRRGRFSFGTCSWKSG